MKETQDSTLGIPEKDFKQIQGIAYLYWKKSFSSIDLDDLIQEGCLAYLEMRQKYDESKNNYFMGFAYLRVKGAILDFISKHSIYGKETVRKLDITNTKSNLTLLPEEFADPVDPKWEENQLVEAIFVENIISKFDDYLGTIPELDYFILTQYFYEEHSMSKIERNLKIGRFRIKQIITKHINKLREELGVPTDIPLYFSKGG